MPPTTQAVAPVVRVQKTERQKTSEDISHFQKSKENSIKIQSAGRDAVLIAVAKLRHKDISEEEIKAEIKKWRDWMYTSIYDVPF